MYKNSYDYMRGLYGNMTRTPYPCHEWQRLSTQLGSHAHLDSAEFVEMAPEDPIDVSDDLVDDEGSVSACETKIKLIKTCYDLMI